MAKSNLPPRPKKYLTNKELLAELEKCRANDKMSNELAIMFQKLTDRYSSVPNLVGYPEDMRQYAMFMLVRTWKSFNPEVSKNPFAFFTQCIKNSFYQYLNREKRQRMIRDQVMIYSGLNPSYGFQAEYDENNRANREMGDTMDDDFEQIITPDVELDTSLSYLQSIGAKDVPSEDDSTDTSTLPTTDAPV